MEEQNNNREGSDEILYTGNKIPKFLMVVYVVFLTWAAFYFLKYSFPDLLKWLHK